MEVDPQKIQQQVNALNVDTPGQIWIVLDGFSALTTVEFKDDGPATFDPSRGLPLKTFINTVTGEVKIFHANMFKADNSE